MAQVSAAHNNLLLSQLLEVTRYDSRMGKVTIVDDTSETDVTYVGVAHRGAEGSQCVWEITKIDESAEDILFDNTNITILVSDPNSCWDNRLFLPYNAKVYETFDSTFDETFG
jgi:hypothetical protein